MNTKPLFIIVMVIALATMACNLSINLPTTEITTGELVTEEINIPTPEDTGTTTDLDLKFGAGKLEIGGGAANNLVSGTAAYNVPDFKPEITTSGNRVRIEQGDLDIRGIPDFNDNLRNEWRLQVGDAPVRLSISAGAYQANYDFGGLSITDLEISDGAANVNLSFDELNLVEMDTFRYTTGASDVTLDGLANANFDRMIFRSGAGSYTLNFSGELQRDASIQIDAGISNLVVIVPDGVNAVVDVSGGLSNVDPHGSWRKQGDQYSLDGSGPTLTFNIQMGAGNLDLRNQ